MNTTRSMQALALVMAPENKPFWDAANQEHLLVKGCRDCGHLHWYPRALCPWCLSKNTQWCPVQGCGWIDSYTRIGGTVIIYVQLVEGVSMLGRLIDVDPEQVRIGALVEVCFASTGSGQKIPMFKRRNDEESWS